MEGLSGGLAALSGAVEALSGFLSEFSWGKFSLAVV
jgi:hypothetical protein